MFPVPTATTWYACVSPATDLCVAVELILNNLGEFNSNIKHLFLFIDFFLQSEMYINTRLLDLESGTRLGINNVQQLRKLEKVIIWFKESAFRSTVYFLFKYSQ